MRHILTKSRAARDAKSLGTLIVVAGLLTTSSFPAFFSNTPSAPRPLFTNPHIPGWFKVSNAISFALSLLTIFTALVVILSVNADDQLPGQPHDLKGRFRLLFYVSTVSFRLSLLSAMVAVVLGVCFLPSNETHAALVAFVLVLAIVVCVLIFFLVSSLRLKTK